MTDGLTIADKTFSSRLFIGSSGYPNQQVMLDAITASTAEVVTVAIRRINIHVLKNFRSAVAVVLDGFHQMTISSALAIEKGRPVSEAAFCVV